MENNKHAYLIMAHTQPELLKKLLMTIDHERNDIFLHIDRKSELDPKEFRNVNFLKKVINKSLKTFQHVIHVDRTKKYSNIDKWGVALSFLI